MVILSRILFLCVAVLAGGCLRTEQSLVLKPDGSGVLSMAYAVPEATLKKMGESEDMRFDEEQIRREFAEKDVPGVTLLDVQVKRSDAGQAMGLKIGFETLKDLAGTEFYKESSLSLERLDNGTYRFTQTPNSPRERPRGAEELQRMQGFSFTMNLRVPGRIVSTNADATEGGRATWRFDLEEDPRAIERMDTMVYEVVFEPTENGLQEYRRPRIRLHPPATRPDPFAEADR